MYNGIKLNIEQQGKIIQDLEAMYEQWDWLLDTYKARMKRIYTAVSGFEDVKREKRHTAFKVNKCFEAENKILPKLMAKWPNWIVSSRTDSFNAEDEALTDEERLAKMEEVDKNVIPAISDYLKYTFDKQDLKEVIRLRAKNMIRYGIGRAKACYKYNISRDLEYEKVSEEVDGNIQERYIPKTKEKIVYEMPTIEVKNWDNIVYDPRYIRLDDMPWVIDKTEGVRLAYFLKRKDKYMNIDKLEAVCACEFDDESKYKNSILSIAGITPTQRVKSDALTVKSFYWLYTIGDEVKEEKLYEFTWISGTILIDAREITQLPFEDIKCFEDTETHFATGFVEPIIWLQEELNHKKNSASQYINQSLNRTYIWSPNSWINPRNAINAPWGIIATSADAQTALANFVELPHRQIPADYFQEQNDFERQIQALTFTVDTAQPQGNQALTNTATGIKVKFYESNAVIDEVRRHFEEWLERLAYKLLQIVYESSDENIVIKKLDDQGFWEINKEAFRDAMRRYEFKVESWSSSFDSVEQRREDALAKFNIWLQLKWAGVNIDLDELGKGIYSTFEWVDVKKLIKPQMMQAPVMPWGKPVTDMWATPPQTPSIEWPLPIQIP